MYYLILTYNTYIIKYFYKLFFKYFYTKLLKWAINKESKNNTIVNLYTDENVDISKFVN